MTTASYDVIIIGAGPGGYVCAIRLAQYGFNVAVVEKDALGGTCLNWGCIPSKAFIYAAGLYEKMGKAQAFGILADNIRVEMPNLLAWKNEVVKKLTGGIGQLFQNHGIAHIAGTAQFQSQNALLVTDKAGKTQTLSAKHIVIATGSVPFALPHIPYDHTVVLDSTDALDLNAVPQSLVLIGGGVIGLELGVMYAKLGTKVTVVEMLPQLLPGVDKDIADTLRRSLKKRGIEIYLQSKAKQVTVKNGQAAIVLETPKGDVNLSAEKVLVAVGRKPNTQGLALERAGISPDAKGFIPVDAQLKTKTPGVYAIGDITGGALLAHKASKEGLIVADVIAGKSECVDYKAMPAAVFTDPEIATVGLTEAEAEAKGLSVKVGKFPFAASGRALSMGETEGFAKVIADAKTDELLGVHLIGPDVSELIAEAALAIEMGACSEDLALTVHAHPTLPETLMEAAEALHNHAIHIYQPPEKNLKPSKTPATV